MPALRFQPPSLAARTWQEWWADWIATEKRKASSTVTTTTLATCSAPGRASTTSLEWFALTLRFSLKSRTSLLLSSTTGRPWAWSLPADDLGVLGRQTTFPLTMCHGGELRGPASVRGANHQPVLADSRKKVAQVRRLPVSPTTHLISSEAGNLSLVCGEFWPIGFFFTGSPLPSPTRGPQTSDPQFRNWRGTGTLATNIIIPWRSSPILRSWISGAGGLWRVTRYKWHNEKIPKM